MIPGKRSRERVIKINDQDIAGFTVAQKQAEYLTILAFRPHWIDV
jgi:hypothetical protein